MAHTTFLISRAISQPPTKTTLRHLATKYFARYASFFYTVMESGRLFPSQDPRLSHAKLYWHFLIYIPP